MEWKENPAHFFCVWIESCVSCFLCSAGAPASGISKSRGGPGLETSAAAVQKWQVGSRNTYYAVVRCQCYCWAPRSSWVPLWKMCLESDKPGLWNSRASQQGEALKEAVVKTVVRELNSNYKQDLGWGGHLDALTLGPWIQVRAKKGYKKTFCRWSASWILVHTKAQVARKCKMQSIWQIQNTQVLR